MKFEISVFRILYMNLILGSRMIMGLRDCKTAQCCFVDGSDMLLLSAFWAIKSSTKETALASSVILARFHKLAIVVKRE